MNLRVNSGLAALFLIPFFFLNDRLEGFIYFDTTETNKTSIVAVANTQSRSSELIQSLERITCLDLEVRKHYLRLYEPTRSLYASLASVYRLDRAIPADRRCSATAKQLLLSAMRDSSVYKVRENRNADLGRVTSTDYIELDFSDLGEIVFRDLPREAFDSGMIFLHELAHRHLNLKDPNKEAIKNYSLVKGDTISFINMIEKELNLPQRRHYAPVKIRHVNGDIRWGIYYGNGSDRVELNPKFGLK
jgi:hypothetical protein